MFLFQFSGLIALIGLFLQAFVGWVFVGLLAWTKPRSRRSPAYDSFFWAFVALAAGLTLLAVRYFCAHDVAAADDRWSEGNLWPRVIYGCYQGAKALFALLLVRGSHHLAERAEPAWLRRGALPIVVVYATSPLWTGNMHLLLLAQAPLMIGSALWAFRTLDPAHRATPSLQLVRLSLLGLAAAWAWHGVSAATVEWFSPSGVQIGLNSLLDLAVQLVLGAGLLLGLIEDAHGRAQRAEQERERLQRQLERDERLHALGTLVSGVAHELNGPLTVILGHADLLDGEARGMSESLRILVEQAERCRGIVRSLSALAGQSLHPHQELDVAELLARVERGLGPGQTDGGKRLVVDVPAGLVLCGDRAGLEQVLTNLVVNALQASPPSGVVHLRAAATGERIEFTVLDEGAGVPRELRARLFEPFVTTKQPGRGTGLGLSIAHAIVRAHDGTLDVEDGPDGRGALFRARFPARRAVHTDSATTDVARPSVNVVAGRRLLLIDDDDAVRGVLGHHAQRRGWEVLARASAEDALAEPDLGSIAAILCDLRMPGMGGVGLYDLLERERAVMLERCFFMTGDLAAPELAEFVARCRRPLFHKPFDFDDLFGALESGTGRTGDIELDGSAAR